MIFAGWTLGCTLTLSAPKIRWVDLSLFLHRQWREKLQSILLSLVSDFIHLQMLASWWLWWAPRRGPSIQLLLLETEKQPIRNDQVFLPASGHLVRRVVLPGIASHLFFHSALSPPVGSHYFHTPSMTLLSPHSTWPGRPGGGWVRAQVGDEADVGLIFRWITQRCKCLTA